LTGAAGCGKTVSVSLLKLYEGHSSKPCCIAALLFVTSFVKLHPLPKVTEKRGSRYSVMGGRHCRMWQAGLCAQHPRFAHFSHSFVRNNT
jgi:hypothetical protein